MFASKVLALNNIAIIDLGSNSARLVLAHVINDGYFVVYDELKESVRLAQDMERDGYLKQARIAQAVKTLKMFRKLCDANNVEKIYAFATNAVRKAKNQRSFLEEINTVCGFKMDVLSEEQEATQIYYGVINSVEVPKGVIMDLSGSSFQLIQYNRRMIVNRVTLPIGTMTLSSLFNENTTPLQQAQMIETYMRDQFAGIEWLKTLDPEYKFVGVGGSFRNLASIVQRIEKYPLPMVHNYHIGVETFNKVYDMIKVLDGEKRTKIKGLSAQRADIFCAALSSIKSFLDSTEFDEIIVSGSGIREGFLFNHTVPTTIEKPITDILGYSIYTRLHYFDLNVSHAEHVCNLAIQLYKQLRVLHKLPRQYVRVLRIAALMHETGGRISFYNHYKHSNYSIMNSNLYGVSHRDLVLAAFVVRAHDLDDMSYAEWNKYSGIVQEEDFVAVMRLAVILRIADSLDRSMSGSVKSLTCDVLGDSVIMKTEVEGDCSLEIKDALSAGADFAKAYKKNLEIL
ncbi:MAG: Ppx/GppA family phosphatase [Clostridiales bacterium]|nr:Ppx/GppA family phosphatase [Clostridiales bacterium]